MKILRELLNTVSPHFEKGGRLEKLYPLYEAVDTLFYTPGAVTKSASHVRDGADLKRVMITVYLCIVPALLWGVYMIGYNAISVVNDGQGGYFNSDWRWELVSFVLGDNLQAKNFVDAFIYGLVYFLPLYLTVFSVAMFWEVLFASIRKHEVNEGFFVTTILFVLTLPPNIPLWQVAVGISFGIVVGKEIFGGTGKNFMNPALVGRAFLYFAYPADLSGTSVWIVADGYSGATALASLADSGVDALTSQGLTWWDSFLGFRSGSIGEMSILLISIGGIILLLQRIASWRIVVGAFLGLVVMSLIFNIINLSPIFSTPFYWHFVLGGFAFGVFFMATDPVSASMTPMGRWLFGFLVGALTVLIRVINPAFPEGVMLAILFANICAPLIDYFVIQSHIKVRNKRRQISA